MVFDWLREGVGEGGAIEQVQRVELSGWVGGGCWSVFVPFSPLSHWGILGQGGVQRLAITSAQPLLSGTLLLSSSFSFPPPVGVRIAVSRASSCL